MSFYPCNTTASVRSGNSATVGGVLFSAGLLGNLLALALLARSGLGSCRPRPQPSVFYVLVCGLTVTDLLGKCLVSPVVLAAYAQNRSLRGLAPAQGDSLCQAFAFIMSFFGLASTLQLLAMALECWLSLGHPFFYQRHITVRRGVLVAPAVGAFSLAFCALPFVGFGNFVQYCPGTWCFFQMISGDDSPSVKGYSVLYSTLMALLVLAIVLCNLGAMRNLYTMHQRLRRHTRCCSLRDRAGEAFPQSLEELDHLLLLALMTVLFTMCTLPLVVQGKLEFQNDLINMYRAYYGAFKAVEEEPDDLLALRFLSVISIVDPWIFIIFRTSVFRMFFHKIFIRPLLYRNWHCHFYQTNVESSL
ncbi:prostaglandin D2 receptor isoform X1 [Cavia porcellus]|uniref:prostaglandin D2 receptor isoform X1 n=1 Tax=Cavia porcellus TaxID=10141 RepID=UPI000661B7E4